MKEIDLKNLVEQFFGKNPTTSPENPVKFTRRDFNAINSLFPYFKIREIYDRNPIFIKRKIRRDWDFQNEWGRPPVLTFTHISSS